MKFIVKFAVFVALLSSLALLPAWLSIPLKSLAILLVGSFFALAIYTALFDLNLFAFPSFLTRRNSKINDDESRLTHYVNYNGIKVYYTRSLNGGGVDYSYEFVKVIESRFGKVGHIHEYCCGPGFIGFNLLANGLCDTLSLSDINSDAVAAVKETISRNGLHDRVKVYSSDRLRVIPKAQRWDLVVGNPPWDVKPRSGKNLILSDIAGSVHRDFFKDIKKHLVPDGAILFVESHEYTKLQDMVSLADETACFVDRYYPPYSLRELFRQLGNYRGLSKPGAITLRLATNLLELYIVQFRLRRSDAGT